MYHVRPTRIGGSDNPHVLDLVKSNNSFTEEIIHLAPLGNSDHSVLSVRSSLQYNDRLVDKLNFNKGDYEGLKQSLDID